MNHLEELAADHLEADGPPHELEPPRRAADTPTGKHEEEQDHENLLAPYRKVSACVARGGKQGRRLEGAVPERFFEAGKLPVAPQHGAHQEASDGKDREVDPKLRVAGGGRRVGYDRLPEQRKIHRRHEHERDDDPLHRGGEGLDAPGLRREAAGGNRGKDVCEGLIRRHAGGEPGVVHGEEQRQEHHRTPNVQQPQAPGRLGDVRGQPL